MAGPRWPAFLSSDEANYDTLDALVAQINLDADQARAHFRDHRAVPQPATGSDPAL